MADEPKMKDFTLTGPGGVQISGRAPEDYTADQIIDEYIAHGQKTQPTPTPSAAATSLDVAASFGSGVEKGVMGIAGLPRQAEEAVGKGIEWLGHKVGIETGPIKPRLPFLRGKTLPTAEQVKAGVEKLTGPTYEPKTTAGRYSQAVGEAVPAVAAGPESMLAKGGMAIGSGVASEFGGEVAPKFGVGSEWGRMVGGILGGGISGAATNEALISRWSAGLKDKAAILKAGSQSFEEIKNARLKVKPNYVDQLRTDVLKELDNDLYDATSAPRTFNAVGKLEATSGDIGTIMSIEQSLNKIKPSAGSDFAAAIQVRAKIFDFIDNIPPQAVLSGDAKYTLDMWRHGKANWRAGKKLELVENANEVGELRASATGTGQNVSNALRQRFLSIINSEGKSRGFSKEAKDKMLEIIEGTAAMNLSRAAGQFKPTSVIRSLPTLGLFAMGEGGLGAAVGIVGTLSHELSKYLTRRQVRELADIIRLEAPINKPVAAAAGPRPSNVGVLPSAAAAGTVEASNQ